MDQFEDVREFDRLRVAVIIYQDERGASLAADILHDRAIFEIVLQPADERVQLGLRVEREHTVGAEGHAICFCLVEQLVQPVILNIDLLGDRAMVSRAAEVVTAACYDRTDPPADAPPAAMQARLAVQ